MDEPALDPSKPSLHQLGPAAPPRRNGELVFEAPWESRLFGLTLALCQGGHFEWEEFRLLLIAEIGAFDAAGLEPGAWSYYACWRAALERALVSKGILGPLEVEARARLLGARAPGHDHHHGDER